MKKFYKPLSRFNVVTLWDFDTVARPMRYLLKYYYHLNSQPFENYTAILLIQTFQVMAKHWKIILFGLLIFHLFLFASTQFTAWPEMLFWPYLMLKGWLPYRDIAIAHSPLLVVVLTAFYKLIGVGIWQQKIISWLIPLFSDCLLFYFFNKLFGIKKALLSLAFYIPFQVYYDGNGIWFDHALAVFPIMIFYCLEKKKFFLTGLLWAVSFLTKQTAFWFSLPILYYFLIYPNKKKFIVDSLKGFLAVISLFLVILVALGIQGDYFHWSIIFGIFTLPNQTAQIKWPVVRQLIASLTPFLIYIPLLFSKLNRQKISIFLWSIVGMMGVLPRFELFHFQPALPFIALGYSILVFGILQSKGKKYFLFIPLLTLVLVPRGIYRKINKQDRFIEPSDQMIVASVKNLTTPSQTIFVTNYWDNLYPLTNTFPATRPFVPQLLQYVNQPGIEDTLIANLDQIKPKVVIRGEYNTPGSETYRFEKINHFIDNNYMKIDTIGEIEIMKIK